MKLFNDIAGEQSDKGVRDHVTPPERREPQLRSLSIGNHFGDDPPLAGDPLRFDMIDDEFDEYDSVFTDSHEGETDYENVDVQAILFYGHTGRRCFPTIKAL